MSKNGAYVLDASALLCLLFSEKGADRVEAVMSGAKVSAVNYAEVVTKLIDRQMDPRETISDLAELDVEIVPVDQSVAETAALLRTSTREVGLSLGDRFCLALAKQTGARAVTTDKAWQRVAKAAEVSVVVVR